MVAIERQTRPSPSASPSADGIPAGARRRTGSPRQVLAACMAGAVVLGLLSSRDSPAWSERASGQPLAAAAGEMASAWDAYATRLGLDSPHQALRRAVRWLIELQWR